MFLWAVIPMGLNYKTIYSQKEMLLLFLVTSLLLNHVAFQFNWARNTKVILRAASILFAVYILSYFIHSLYTQLA